MNPETTKDVSVKITDTNENGIGNATVVLSNGNDEYTGTTGNAGGCTIRNVPLGEYAVEVSANGYVDETTTFTVTSGTNNLEVTLIEQQVDTPIVYNFTSYSDAEKTTEWGTGTVETTGTITNGYTEVEVLTNSSDESFVGEKFYITSDAQTDGTVYELFTDAGTTSAGIYVTISES